MEVGWGPGATMQGTKENGGGGLGLVANTSGAKKIRNGGTGVAKETRGKNVSWAALIV